MRIFQRFSYTISHAKAYFTVSSSIYESQTRLRNLWPLQPPNFLRANISSLISAWWGQPHKTFSTFTTKIVCRPLMTKAIGIRLEKYVFSEAVIVVVVLVRLLAIASRARVLYVCLCRCLYGSFTARAAILAELLYKQRRRRRLLLPMPESKQRDLKSILGESEGHCMFP